MKNKQMLEKKEWSKFRDTGLLLFVNFFLHIFGWAIAMDIDDETGKVIECFPARTRFRGFDEKSQDKAYFLLSEYMRKNASALLSEASDENEYAQKKK
jgi:hypothetical protein